VNHVKQRHQCLLTQSTHPGEATATTGWSAEQKSGSVFMGPCQSLVSSLVWSIPRPGESNLHEDKYHDTYPSSFLSLFHNQYLPRSAGGGHPPLCTTGSAVQRHCCGHEQQAPLLPTATGPSPLLCLITGRSVMGVAVPMPTRCLCPYSCDTLQPGTAEASRTIHQAQVKILPQLVARHILIRH
jgi:hypothetical protein